MGIPWLIRSWRLLPFSRSTVPIRARPCSKLSYSFQGIHDPGRNEGKWKFIPAVIRVWKEPSGYPSNYFCYNFLLCRSYVCYHTPAYTHLPQIKLDLCYWGTKWNGHWGDTTRSLLWGFYDMIMGGGILGLLRCWSSSCSAPRSLQFTLCPLKILSGVCLYLLSFWVEDPNRHMLTMALLSLGFLSSSFLVPPNLGNSLKMRELYKPDCDPRSPSIWRHWKWGHL